MKTIGIIILLLGIALTIFTTFKYFTTEEVVDLGRVEITKEEPKRVSWSPWVGVAVMAVGGFVLWQAGKKSN